MTRLHDFHTRMFHIWDSETSAEDKPEAGNNWHRYLDNNPQDAANALAQSMLQSGNYPDHEKFLINVKELATKKLYQVICDVEYTPYTYPKKIIELS